MLGPYWNNCNSRAEVATIMPTNRPCGFIAPEERPALLAYPTKAVSENSRVHLHFDFGFVSARRLLGHLLSLGLVLVCNVELDRARRTIR